MTSARRVAVVGAGWTGAVAARTLSDVGVRVEVFERAAVIGGHSRVEELGGVVYEPNGAHIFHTSNPVVADFVHRFGMGRAYEHKVLTEVFLDADDEEGRMLSWPPQVDELRQLPVWPRIERELAGLPPAPVGEDFESYATSLMGRTLYELFIEGYTIKQWDRHPSTLSSRFAPKRIDLRSDGDRRLFKDRWEFFEERGVNDVIGAVLQTAAVTCGAPITAVDLDDLARSFDVVVVTAPLDDFAGEPGTLEWRGITMRSTRHPVDDPSGTLTPAYVVNRPSPRVPYTRTVETKHATGQRIAATVVSEELPGAPARHYPVPTVDRRNERRNDELKAGIVERSPLPLVFAGRLANYQYINQDQAIEQGLACADEVLAVLAADRAPRGAVRATG